MNALTPVNLEIIPPAAAARRTGAGGLASRLILPLWSRWRRGEGYLAAANACYIWTFGSSRPVLDTLLSVAALASVYALNDFSDAGDDLLNPRKDVGLARLFLEDRVEFGIANVYLQILLIGAAYLLHGGLGAAAMVALFAANACYSLVFKGVPGLDILSVAVCGTAYAGTAGIPLQPSLVLGVSAAICHCSQMSLDRGVDRVNNVRTAAVHSPRLVEAALILCGVALFGLLASCLGVRAACSAAIPVGIGLGVPDKHAAWSLSRMYFAPILLAVLVHGHVAI